MVVTRRQSATPVPAVASRTNSSAGTSRLGKGKAVDRNTSLKESGAGPSRNTPNGIHSKAPVVGPQTLEDIVFDDANDPPVTPSAPTAITPKPKAKPKSKKASKFKKHRANKKISIFDILSRIFLLWLTIYTITVCPEDVEQRSLVCRALTEYRRLILEPYVYPPVRAALEHPSIAPTVRCVQPYYNSAIKATAPIIRRSKYEWRTKAIPQVRWLQIRARPYVRQVERKYDATLGPYVHRVLVAYHLKIEPHVRTLELTAFQKWKTVKPYVRPLWRGGQQLPGIIIRTIGQPLGDARRRWVDPHVTKIWDAVMEQEKANVSNVKLPAESITPQVSVTASEKATGWAPFSASTTSENATDEPSTAPPPIPELTDDAFASAASIIANSLAVLDSTPSASPLKDAPEATPESAPTPWSVLEEADVLAEITSLGDATLPAMTDEAAAAAVSIMEESLFQSTAADTQATSEFSHVTSSISSEVEPTPTEVIFETASVIFGDDEELESSLDDFLLEINAVEPEPEVEEVISPPVYEDETPEHLAERLRRIKIEAAEKRADIEGRHTQWEIDLEKFGNAKIEVVEVILRQRRDVSVEEAQNPGSAVRSQVENLTQEAEKSLKSLRAYARKLAAEAITEVEKIKTWDSVVSKVDKKFGQKVDTAADGVKAWWESQVQREIGEIQVISLEVKGLAFRAQSDIGMDYSWLGDVTYMDWQRYHKLVDTADSFEELYLRMQNGADENSPPNPLIDVMQALQEEVDDMILGFETNLSRAKSAALELFTEPDKVTDPTSEAPEVSILPIEPIPVVGKVDPIPPVVLSRGAEEVEAAINRAEEARTTVSHEEL